MIKRKYDESTLSKIFSLLERKDKSSLLIMFLLSLGSSVLELLTAGAVIIFTQSLINPKSLESKLFLVGWENITPTGLILCTSILVALVYIVKNIWNLLEIFFLHINIQNIKHRFKLRIIDAYTLMKYEQYLPKSSSEIVSLTSVDVELFFNNGLVALVIIFSETCVLISICCVLFYIDPFIIISLAISFIALYTISSLFFSPRIHKSGKMHRETFERSIACVTEIFRSFKEIIINNKAEYFKNIFEKESLKNTQAQAFYFLAATCPRVVIEMLFVVVFSIAISIMYFNNYSPDRILLIISVIAYSGFRIMPVLNRILVQYNTLKSTKACISTVHKAFMELPTVFMYPSVPNFRFNKSICFKDVSYKYKGSSTPILNNMSLTIQKGECIGIIGKSGSGKSTLINLLLGLLSNTSGSIIIDAAFPVKCREWLNHIGYIPQQINLTNDTLKNNIAFGVPEEEVDEERVQEAIEASQLKEFVEQLPCGLDTIIGENGAFLSGGERQRIGFARALYKKPEILVLDEATSALDINTEEKLVETIRLISKDKTVIIVAHRLSTLKYCDRILEVRNRNIFPAESTCKIKVKKAATG